MNTTVEVAETVAAVEPKKVFIVGNNYRGPTVDCFESRNGEFVITGDFNDADIYVFTGGEDIYPGLYGEKTLPGTHYNGKRDQMELDAYGAIEKGKAKVGICRGAQFLNVMNGGKMWQDVNNHGGGRHHIFTSVKNLFKDDKALTNSIHHQMMIPSSKGEVLAVAYESDYRIKANKEVRGTFFTDPEVIWYKEDRAFCFQAHPEFGHKETTDTFFTFLKHVGI